MRTIIIILLFSINAYTQCLSGNCNNGKGVRLYDTDKYIGDFKNNERHGSGTLYYESGKVSFKGIWKEDGAWEGISYDLNDNIDAIYLLGEIIDNHSPNKELFNYIAPEFTLPNPTKKPRTEYIKSIIISGKKGHEIYNYWINEEMSKQKKEQLAKEKEQLVKEKEHNQEIAKQRKAKIQANLNYLKWTKGDKICLEINEGILMGVIDDWNENKSKAKIKVIAGPNGNYEGEQIIQGSYIWASTVGKGWHLCLDEEIEKAVENNQSINNATTSNGNKISKGEISFEMKGVAAKFAKLAGKQISYKCRNYGVPSNLNAEIGEIKYFEEGGGGFIVDIVYRWNDKDMTNRNVTEMYQGKITFDQYGCNGLFIISSKSNGGGFFSTGKQGACFTAIPENKKEIYRQLEPNASWFINVECLE